MNRSSASATKWLWLVLAVCLIGWRVSSRVAQYHSAVVSAGHGTQVAYFDANERQMASIAAVRSHARDVAEHVDVVLPVAGLALPVCQKYLVEWEARTELPPIYVDAVSLFSNPPPAALLS